MAKEANIQEAYIPFGNAARVGNFKVWRGNYTFYEGTNKVDIERIHVSTLDSLWSITIPSTWEMYGNICLSYADYMSDDITRKIKGEMVLTTIFANMMYSSCVANGYFQRAINFAATLYANPSLLTDKKQFKRVKEDAKRLIDDFLKWREEYVEKVAKHQPTEKEDHQDEVAEMAVDVLSKEEDSN